MIWSSPGVFLGLSFFLILLLISVYVNNLILCIDSSLAVWWCTRGMSFPNVWRRFPALISAACPTIRSSSEWGEGVSQRFSRCTGYIPQLVIGVFCGHKRRYKVIEEVVGTFTYAIFHLLTEIIESGLLFRVAGLLPSMSPFTLDEFRKWIYLTFNNCHVLAPPKLVASKKNFEKDKFVSTDLVIH